MTKLEYFTQIEAAALLGKHLEIPGVDNPEEVIVIGIEHADQYVITCEGVFDRQKKYTLSKTEYAAIQKPTLEDI